MKHLFQVRSISTVLFVLFFSTGSFSARADAPLAMLTDVAGSVQIVRAGKSLAAKSGAKLQAGDRVVSRGGKATIYYLGRAPQKLAAGASATIGAAKAGNGSGVWKGVYAGVSGGFDARPRVAATVRDKDRVLLLAPVESLVSPTPRLVWQRGKLEAPDEYEVAVYANGTAPDDEEAATPIWQTTTKQMSVQYPATAPALQAGSSYYWTVTPRRDGKAIAEESASSWLRVATPAQNQTLQTGLDELKTLADAPTLRTAKAAWAASLEFRALALETLGIDQTTNFTALDETRRALLRSVFSAEQQSVLLDAREKESALAAVSTVATPDADLPVDGIFPQVPAQTRKLYVDEAGLFSLQIPQTWGAFRQVEGDINRTDFAPEYPSAMSIAVVIAPLKAEVKADVAATEATGLTARLLQMARAAGAVVEVTASRATTFPQKGASLPARETTASWREKRGETELDWRGSMIEFASDGKSYVLGWSAVQSSTVGIDRTASLLRNLQLSFVAAPDATVGPKTTILPFSKERQDEMMATVNAMTAISERQSQRNTIRSTLVEGGVAQQQYDAAAPESRERADAASALARITEDRAWAHWSKADDASRAEAEQAWQQAEALRRESYQIELQVLAKEVDATDARLHELRGQTTTLSFAAGHAFIIDSWLSVQAMRALTAETLAFYSRDRDTQEKWAKRELGFRRTQLQLRALSPDDKDALMHRAEYADALETVASVLMARADYTASEAHYRRALAWRQALPATFAWRGLEGTWRNLGLLALESGDLIQAREHFQAALHEIDRVQPLEDADLTGRNKAQDLQRRRSGRAHGRAVIWNSLGFIADGLGDYSLARESYERALKYAEEIFEEPPYGDLKKAVQARSLGNLGTLELASGNPDAATKFLDASQVLMRERADASGLAIWIMNQAHLLEQRGDFEGARRAALDARSRFSALRVPERVAFATAVLARLARMEGDAPAALQLAREALQMARATKDKVLLCQATRGLAVSLMMQPEPDWRNFDVLMEESLQLAQQIASPIQQSATLDARGQGKRERGDVIGAEADYRGAIARLEVVRATTANAESFSDTHSAFYERLVRLLLERNRPEEAFDVLQRARSSKLRENLRLGTLKSPDPVLQKLLDRAAELEAKLRTLRAQRETALAAPAPDAAAVENLEGLIASTQAEFFSVSARLKKANPAFDRALTISPLELKKASTSFPAGTVLVQYALLEDELYVFVVSRERLKIYQPKVRSNSVLEAARRFRTLMDTAQSDARAGKQLSTPETDAALRASLTELHSMLIAPIAGELRGQKMLAFVPSGALYYIPLHALARQTPQGLRFVVEDIPVAYLAAGDVLSVVQSRDDERFGAGALALGDPTGADLPEARKEARAVAQILPASQSLVGDAAQKSVLLDSKNLNRRVLHLAMHGVLNAALPDDSYIQLAGTGEASRLRVGEIVGLDLNRVDLVTLSACQTALGERAPSGGEISSLAQSFSSAGAPSVIASLWSVEDDSTRQLMETFYRSYAAGENKAVSLQRAQVALLKQPATRHPFFWAPFELLGDWR
ncbi:MAG TPA: CHAT domain-containing tetratricopeptide repeat protein [Abditibacteriaceae bacterium]|jgi:CHAT domain-containing protein